MIVKIEKRSLWQLAVLLVGGAAAGLLNGFLGAGGGIIFMYLFKWINHDKSELAARDNFASVVTAVLPLSVVSAICYSAKGATDSALIGIYVIPAAIGGVCGAIITDKINTTVLKLVFGIIVVVAGINMIL